MSDFPTLQSLQRWFVGTDNIDCLAQQFGHICGVYYGGVGVWPAASRALYVPVQVQQTLTAYKMACWNGGTVTGGTNTSVGIYDVNGVQLVEARAAAAGASQPQFFDIADTVLKPGNYFLGLSHDSGTTQFGRLALTAPGLQVCGMQQQAAYPLPSPATFANPAAGYAPWIGCMATF